MPEATEPESDGTEMLAQIGLIPKAMCSFYYIMQEIYASRKRRKKLD